MKPLPVLLCLACASRKVRGGDPLLLKSNVVKGIGAFGAVQGLAGALQPREYWQSAGDLLLPDDSVAQWAAKQNGYVTVAIAAMIGLKSFTELSTNKAMGVASLLSTLPSLFQYPSKSRIGLTEEYKLLSAAYNTVVCLALLLFDRPSMRNLVIPSVLACCYGYLFPEQAADDVGLEFQTFSADKTLFVIMSCSVLSLLVLYFSLLATDDLEAAVRNMVIFATVATADVVSLRPNIFETFSTSKAWIFFSFFLSLAALLIFLPI